MAAITNTTGNPPFPNPFLEPSRPPGIREKWWAWWSDLYFRAYIRCMERAHRR